MSRRKEPIRKEDSGRYVVVVDTAAPGEPRRQTKKRFDTYKEARSWLADTRSQVDQQRFVAPAKTTLEQHVETWLPILRTQVRRSTAASYERNLRLHVLPRIGNRTLQSIRPLDLTRMYADLLRSGKLNGRREVVGGLSHRTVSYISTIVGKCLEAAISGELIMNNPARRAEVPKAASTADRHDSMQTWSGTQLRAFLDGARAHRFYGGRNPHHSAWMVLATTGMRRGEVLGLAWSDVDLDAGTLSVRRTLVDVDKEQPIWSDPKTNKGRRTIQLDPATVASLRTHRSTQAQNRLLIGETYAPWDLVFSRPDGGPLHPDRFSRAFVECAKQAGLHPIRLHDLRHTWATLALQSGVHAKVVQERLGHSTIAITLDIYSHVIPAMDAEAANRVAGVILGSPS